MKISLLDPTTLVLEGKGVREWRTAHRKRVTGYQFTPQYRARRWDGYRYPGTMRGKRLLLGRGFLRRLLGPNANALANSDARYSAQIDKVLKSARKHSKKNGLFDFQRNGIAAVATWRWGQVALATNAGKGAIIALLAKAAADGGGKCLILADELSVFQALEEEIEKWSGSPPTAVTRQSAHPPSDPIVLAMVPTLHRRVSGQHAEFKKQEEWTKWLGTFSMLLLDEADKATAHTWQNIMRLCCNTHFRVGFSGTFPDPETVEGTLLEETIGPILIRINNMDLVERKISARPLVELHPFSHPKYTVPDQWYSLRGTEKRAWLYETGVLYNDERHEFLIALLDPDVPNTVIVNRINHGRELAQIIPHSAFLQGSSGKEERMSVLQQFRAGEIRTLIATKILDRGTNLLGHTVGLIFASGEGSNRQTLQRIGRGLRRTGGKEFVFIKDVLDRGHKYFNKASTTRVRVYNQEGFEIKIF